MIRAAFFDIDGTLLSFRTHQVSPGTIQAFDALHSQGILTFISSGRPRQFIPDLPVSFSGHITLNGCYCYVDSEVVLRRPIPLDESDRWLRHVAQNNIVSMAFTEDALWCTSLNEAALQLRQQLEFPMPPMRPALDMLGTEVFQFIAMQPPEDDAQTLALLPHCRMPRWHEAFSDIIHRQSSKAEGLECMLRHFGISPQEVIAFGDGANDIEMLNFANIGVAMGNAAEPVKQQADYVTTSVDDEGILHALKDLKII